MTIQRASFYIILMLVTVAFFRLLIPYYAVVFWAVILAIIFFPVHTRLKHLFQGRHNIAALLTVLMCICIVIIPAMIILASLIQEGTSLYQRISSNEIDLNGYLVRIQNTLPAFLEKWLNALKLGNFEELRQNISSGIMQASRSVAGSVLSFGQNTMQFLVSFGIMLYLLFFLLRVSTAE